MRRIPSRPLLLIVAAVAFLYSVACGHAPAPPPPQAPADEAWLTPQQVAEARLEVAPLAEQEVGGVVVTSGRITFDDLRVAHVYSPVAGRISRIVAQPGQRVKKGAPLAVIQSPDVGAAFSDLAKAQADLVAAEHDYKRQKDLFNDGGTSERAVEAARDAWEKARAEFDRARKKAALFRAGTVDNVSQEYTLPAPIDGEVIARNVNPGAEVQGQYGGGTAVELFTIGELDEVWVVGDLFEQDLAQVKVGEPVTVRVVAYPDRGFAGRVDWVSGSLDPQSHTAKLRCDIKNPQRMLKPEMYATVSIAVAGRRALAVPREAILRLGDQPVVFVEVGRTDAGLIRFARRPIAVVDDEGGDYVPVTHGIEKGERVVTAGAILLSGML